MLEAHHSRPRRRERRGSRPRPAPRRARPRGGVHAPRLGRPARPSTSGTAARSAAQAVAYVLTLQQRTRLSERQPWETRVQRASVTIPEVAEKIRLHVPFRKELLVAAETGLTRGKELFVHLGLIEAGHGPAVEPERARSHDHVRAL